MFFVNHAFGRIPPNHLAHAEIGFMFQGEANKLLQFLRRQKFIEHDTLGREHIGALKDWSCFGCRTFSRRDSRRARWKRDRDLLRPGRLLARPGLGLGAWRPWLART